MKGVTDRDNESATLFIGFASILFVSTTLICLLLVDLLIVFARLARSTYRPSYASCSTRAALQMLSASLSCLWLPPQVNLFERCSSSIQ